MARGEHLLVLRDVGGLGDDAEDDPGLVKNPAPVDEVARRENPVENCEEFAGMPLLLLSLPWSDWLAPVAGASSVAGWLGLLAGVLVNAIALALVGRGLRYLAADLDSGAGTA